MTSLFGLHMNKVYLVIATIIRYRNYATKLYSKKDQK